MQRWVTWDATATAISSALKATINRTLLLPDLSNIIACYAEQRRLEIRRVVPHATLFDDSRGGYEWDPDAPNWTTPSVEPYFRTDFVSCRSLAEIGGTWTVRFPALSGSKIPSVGICLKTDEEHAFGFDYVGFEILPWNLVYMGDSRSIDRCLNRTKWAELLLQFQRPGVMVASVALDFECNFQTNSISVEVKISNSMQTQWVFRSDSLFCLPSGYSLSKWRPFVICESPTLIGVLLPQ
jgi:hypothetical protein